MKAYKYLENKFVKKTGLLVLSVILLAGSVVSLAAGILNKSSQNSNVQFTGVYDEVGAYAYLDVVQISPWLVESDGGETYYLVIDATGYYDIVSVTDSIYEDMAVQQEAYLNDTYDVSYRIYGYVESPSDEFKEVVMEAFGLEVDYFEYLFGNRILNCTSASGSIRYIYLAGFILFAILGFICLALYLTGTKRRGMMLFELEDRGLLDTAAYEVEAAGKTGGYLFTRHFLISQKEKFIVPVDTIRWVYTRKSSRFMKESSTLIINNDECMGLCIDNVSEEDIQTIINQITAVNPHVLIGYTPENIEAYKLKQFPTDDLETTNNPVLEITGEDVEMIEEKTADTVSEAAEETPADTTDETTEN